MFGLGRITEADVAKALEYQRLSGGFFGEALVACGLVSENEIEWGLASQFDLPYVFPDAEEIESLRTFHCDAATVDLAGGEGDWLASALDLGAASFPLWADGADVGPTFETGIRWHLHVARGKEGQLDWSLEPLLV